MSEDLNISQEMKKAWDMGTYKDFIEWSENNGAEVKEVIGDFVGLGAVFNNGSVSIGSGKRGQSEFEIVAPTLTDISESQVKVSVPQERFTAERSEFGQDADEVDIVEARWHDKKVNFENGEAFIEGRRATKTEEGKISMVLDPTTKALARILRNQKRHP